MYRNLEAEITRKGMTKRELAKMMELAPSTMSQKLNGKAVFTYPEAKKVKEILGVEITLEELFSTHDIKVARPLGKVRKRLCTQCPESLTHQG